MKFIDFVPKWAKMYLGCTMGYGALHKYAVLWNGNVEAKIDGQYKMRPMLIGEKLYVFAAGLVYSPFLAPVWATEDLDRIDMYFMGKQPEQLGYDIKRTTLFDYIYT